MTMKEKIDFLDKLQNFLEENRIDGLFAYKGKVKINFKPKLDFYLECEMEEDLNISFESFVNSAGYKDVSVDYYNSNNQYNYASSLVNKIKEIDK